jgi:DNA-binding Lrp family transcriptional regulator
VPEPQEPIDEVDVRILGLLCSDARRTSAAIADDVGLSATAVRRRIVRLEHQGIIVTYTTVLNHAKVTPSIEAFVELDFTPDTDVEGFLTNAVKRPEIREASTLAGHPDAILRMRVRDVSHLREVVTDLRREEGVARSKTMVALDRVRNVAENGQAPEV